MIRIELARTHGYYNNPYDRGHYSWGEISIGGGYASLTSTRNFYGPTRANLTKNFRIGKLNT